MINRGFNIFLVCSNILMTLLILLAYITQSRNIQIIFIQPIYGILDPAWGEIRSGFLLLAAFGGGATLFLNYKIRVINSLTPAVNQTFFIRIRKIIWLLCVVGGEMILGLLVFYGHSCCDNPVIILSGFPLSWLRGSAPVEHYLPIPIVPYIVQNLTQIHWYVDGICLVADLMFWWNVGIIITKIQKTFFLVAE